MFGPHPRVALLAALLGACGDSDPGGEGLRPGGAGAACARGDDCAGGTCLGVPGGPEAGNPRFAGGYCTALACVPGSQDGCGPDEWCVDGGDLGPYCVELCSKAEGVACDREDHVCLGLGAFGGCFSAEAVECDSRAHTGCDGAHVCVRIGFDDATLGRCEPSCDPLSDDCEDDACYYVRRYNGAFCAAPGATAPEEPCTCDICCVEGHACTPDVDGAGKHCKPFCLVSSGCPDGECVPLEAESPIGGCVAPGSAGT